MRRSTFSFIAALLVLALGARASRAELVVEKAVREISVVKALVNVRTQLTLRNDGGDDADDAVVCIEPALAGKLAFIEVTEGTDDDAPLLKAKKLLTNPANAPEGTLCHSVAFSSPLQGKATTTLDVLTVFTKAQRPHPAQIATGQQQRVAVSYSATVVSPYVVESQSTVVRVPGRVESHENADGPPPEDADAAADGTDDGNGGKPRTLSHSAFSASPRPPFSLSRGRVHFVNNAPFAHAERLVREVEVSHWGNVAVRERLAPLHNAGARHRGEWSRLDFSANAEATNPTALQSLLMVLPPGARWFSFRDEIGNISSSTVRAEPEFKIVHGKGGKKKRKVRNDKRDTTPVEAALYPRYPLAGGWRASFEFGWSMPLRFLAAELTGDDRRASLEREAEERGRRGLASASASASTAALSGKRVRLMLPSFFTPIRDVVADELSVVVVLPEGATRVAHYLPFDVDSAVLGKKATYLDTTGRTTLELTLRNAVEDHGSPLVIEYSLPGWRPLVEPAMVVGAVAAVISAIFLSSRVDLSLDSEGSEEAAASAAAAAAGDGGGGAAAGVGDDGQKKKKAKSLKAN